MYDPLRIWGQPENTYNFIFEDMNECVLVNEWWMINGWWYSCVSIQNVDEEEEEIKYFVE